MYFLALCERLKHEEFEETCRRLTMPGKIMDHVFSHRRRALTLQETLQRRLRRGPEVRNSELYESFHGLPLEVLLYLGARTYSEQVRKLVSLYITRLRHVRCELDGNVLRDMGLKPGPHFSQVMRRLLAALLNGEVTGTEEERELARGLIDACCLPASEKE